MSDTLFSDNDTFNGFKCTRHDTPVSEMSAVELVGFIGMLDAELTRRTREMENTIMILRQEKNRWRRWANEITTKKDVELNSYYQEELPPEIVELMDSEI